MKKLGNNNKGAAMVSVLIAVTFIAILATSLCYMAYMNYLTKVMKYRSTDDFFTAEYGLDDLTSTLQETGDMVKRSNATATVDDAIKQIRLDCCGTPLSTALADTRYDGARVASLMQVAGQDATFTVSSNVPASSKNFIINGNSVTLKGLVITATDAEGYTSTITTDVEIQWQNDPAGKIDVNDFSMISDAPVTVGEGTTIINGYAYMQGYGRKMDSNHEADALTVQTGAICQLFSPQAIINGDVTIKKNAMMSITGKVQIVGDLTIEDGATLLCTGELTVCGSVHNNGRCKPASIASLGHTPIPSAIPKVDKKVSEDPDAQGLEKQIFADKVYLYETKTNSWVYFKPREVGHNLKVDKTLTLSTPSGKYSNKDMNVLYSAGTHDYNVSNDIKDTLLLVPNATVTVRKSVINSTILSEKPYVFGDNAHTVAPRYMQKIDKELYNELLDSYICMDFKTDSIDIYDAATDHKLNSSDYSGKIKFASSYKRSSGDAVLKTSTNTKKYTPSGSTEGGPRVIFTDASGNNYVRYRYLLSANTSQLLSKVFGSFGTSPDPSVSTVTVSNWFKD